jgi:tRNA pseudouridine55 synthase
VARVRRLAGTRKVGHAGTLDPMATGLLVCGVNRATRLLTYLVGVDKTYLATIRLGLSTVTDDAEGEVTAAVGAVAVAPDRVRAGVRQLTGPLQQVPSSVSAIKVDGRRSYARVRSGEEVELAARAVTVHRFDVLAVRSGEHAGTAVLDVDVEVECSSGTYVRALARDLGAALGTGGHLVALRRTRVGPFGIEQARPLGEPGDDLEILPAATAAATAFAVRRLDEAETVALGHGRRLAATGLGAGPVAALAPDGTLVALLTEDAGAARPLVVFAAAGG